MTKPVVLVTGANGEIGRSLLERVHATGRYNVVTVDLTPLPERLRSLCMETYAGNIMDRYLLDQIAAHHEIEVVFHLAALLSTRGERDPELAHQVNVEGTLHLLRVAQNQSQRLGRAVRFIFPSSIAVYGLPARGEGADGAGEGGALDAPHHDVRLQQALLRAPRSLLHELLPPARRARERVSPRLPRAPLPRPHLRRDCPHQAIATSTPRMLHAAAQGKAYACFVGPGAKIPFMVMPAIRN